jgi:predicted nucleic acid-binding protein
MKPILILGIVVGVMLITIAMFMYFYRLDNNVINNTKNIEFLRKNDSVFLIMERIAQENDSIKLKLLNENHRLLITDSILLQKLTKTKSK